MPPLLRGISPPIGTPLSRGSPAYRHPLIKGAGGSNLKSIFNLIITSYLKLAEYFASRETKNFAKKENLSKNCG
ncbi:MAG: hypothetical protein BEV12_03670 [Microcystis aeruginosa CACIAM 03]|nr:MAG: hypothetical protein BEV12_03670 [Microcystis aeruginosa CACIAM 03]